MGQSLRKQFNRIPFHRAYTSIYWSIATFAFIALPLCMWAQGVHVLALEAEARKPTADPGIVASVPTHTWANGVFTEQYTNAQPVTNSTRDAHLELPCANDSLNLTPIPPASIEARKHWKHPFRILHGQTKRPGSLEPGLLLTACVAIASGRRSQSQPLHHARGIAARTSR